jgi:Pyridoxamine 5'-phosphate oxidase
MAVYGVPEDPAGALPWAWAEERLVRSRNYWIVSVDPAGRPHATPVWGVWRAEAQRFWFSCAPESLKARNLVRNPAIVVAPDDAVEVVSLEGVAFAIDGDGDRAEEYARKYEPDTGRRASLADFVLSQALFEVEPTKAIGVIEREDEFAARATRWVW